MFRAARFTIRMMTARSGARNGESGRVDLCRARMSSKSCRSVVGRAHTGPTHFAVGRHAASAGDLEPRKRSAAPTTEHDQARPRRTRGTSEPVSRAPRRGLFRRVVEERLEGSPFAPSDAAAGGPAPSGGHAAHTFSPGWGKRTCRQLRVAFMPDRDRLRNKFVFWSFAIFLHSLFHKKRVQLGPPMHVMPRFDACFVRRMTASPCGVDNIGV